MTKLIRIGALAGALAISSGASAQHMFRFGYHAGSGVADWGPSSGIVIGFDELEYTRAHGWWTASVDAGHRRTKLRDGEKITRLRIIDPYRTRSDTTRLRNDFSVLWATIGGRYEPCRRYLGFRQTKNRIISPFVSFHVGYARMDHEQGIGGQGITGVGSPRGVPLGGAVGVMLGWGGPPEGSLDPNVSSTYWGAEIRLDATNTVWLKDRKLIRAQPGVTGDIYAPLWPMVTLRVMFMYRRAPVRSDG